MLRSLLVVLALAGAACNDGDARQANAPTTRSATVSTTATVAGSSATSRVAAAGDGCPPSTDAAVAEAATLTLGPSAGVPPTEASGVAIVITGTVYDERCTPVAGTTLHLWQTDADGVYGPGHGTNNLQCCYLQGTVQTDTTGRYQLVTVMPGHYKGAQPPPPAHIHVDARRPGSGSLMTEIVFAGDPYLTNPDADGYVVVTLSPAPGASDPRRGVADLVLAAGS
jgi:protocatechuate 3,4-dioxygenase beta subunit